MLLLKTGRKMSTVFMTQTGINCVSLAEPQNSFTEMKERELGGGERRMQDTKTELSTLVVPH